MKAYIIGYNFKFNLGDDLMLASNVKFAKRLGCREINVVEWSKSRVRFESVKYFDMDLVKISGRFYYISLLLFFNAVFGKTVVVIGGGNLFDSRVMGRRLFVLALILRLSGALIYMRGVGLGVERWFTKYIAKFRCRFRGRVVCASNRVFKDTAYWAINSKIVKKPENINFERKYDYIIFPRDVGGKGNKEQIKIIFELLKNTSSVCFYIMDRIKYDNEKLLVQKLASHLQEVGVSKIDLKIYQCFDDVLFDMGSSEACIAARLHAGIVWKKFCAGKLVVIPYSIKHKLEFHDNDVEFTKMIVNEGG